MRDYLLNSDYRPSLANNARNFSLANELPRSKLTGYPQLTAKMETQQVAGNLSAEIKKTNQL
jgi:hypothetical protein